MMFANYAAIGTSWENTKSNRQGFAPEAYQETSRQLYLDIAFCLLHQKDEAERKRVRKQKI